MNATRIEETPGLRPTSEPRNQWDFQRDF